MHTVEDDAGRRYLLLKRSGESSLVRDVATGEERYLPNEALDDLDGVDPLTTAAEAVPDPFRRLLTTVHDDRGLGLLVLLDREPRSARTLLGATDLCESDLLGLATELRAAGLIAETTVDGERGYAVTEEGRAAIEQLQPGGSGGQSAETSSAESPE